MTNSPEFNPRSSAEARQQFDRESEWLDHTNPVNVLDNEMYLLRVNPDGTDSSMLPLINNVHEYDEDEYTEKSLSELLKMSAEAEVKGDRTTMSNVDDYILDKIDSMDLEDEYVELDGSLRDTAKKEKDSIDIIQKSRKDGKTELKSELDNFYDRAMKLRSNYVEELAEATNKPTEKNETLPPPAPGSVPVKENGSSTEKNKTLPPPTGKRLEADELNELPADPTIENTDEAEAVPGVAGEDDKLVIATVSDDDLDFDEIFDEDINEDEDFLPPVIVNTDLPEPTQEKKSKRRLTALLAGAAALIGVLGLAASGALDDDSSNSDKAPVEVAVEGETIELDKDTLDQLTAFDEDAEASEEDSETDQAESNDEELNEDLKNLQIAKIKRLNEISAVTVPEGELDVPFNRVKASYGESQAAGMLIEAVETLQSEGRDIKWSEDPYSSDRAYIIAGDSTDTKDIMMLINPKLVDIELRNFFDSQEAEE